MPVTKPSLPETFDKQWKPFVISDAGTWLILSDIHIPYHDRLTIELAVRTAIKSGASGVLLNGDVVDSHEISTFDKDPTMPRYIAERDAAIQFQAWLRDRMPKARIVWKLGNHEERLDHYLWRHAPALFGLDALKFDEIMRMRDFGIEPVADMRVVELGKLNVIHGHEYKPIIQAPVNPARGLFLRAKANSLCGHWHQTSEHHEPTIAGKPLGCWSTGCACQLSPVYRPLNKWCHGFATVEVFKGSEFSVRNYRVIKGEVV